MQGAPSKAVRLGEFVRRLDQAPPAQSFSEAYEQLCDILNQVEDELTDIPSNPNLWQSDGRLYPPQLDNVRRVPGRPLVRRLRSRQHNIYIGENGSVEIEDIQAARTILSKPGLDARGVQDL